MSAGARSATGGEAREGAAGGEVHEGPSGGTGRLDTASGAGRVDTARGAGRADTADGARRDRSAADAAPASRARPRRLRPALSLRSTLLIGILLPVLVLVAINTVSLYRQALRAADTAYDRTLLASARSIGEQLEVVGEGDDVRLIATVPYATLETFEADNRSRMFYKVSGFDGELVSGFADLPAWRGTLPVKGPYAALADFYDDAFRGQPVRVAVLLQPVAGVLGHGMATIQVAETLELRQTLARQILVNTLWRQALLVFVVTLVVVVVVQRATRPVRSISARLRLRSENDLAPIAAGGAPRELLPLIDATNQVMARLADLLTHQKRFVRDTAHQLRTPLAVLHTQLQSALRGDVDATQAMHEMSATVERATLLANQMLALAKVEQLRQQDDAPVSPWDAIVRAVALDLAPLIAQRQIEFEIATVAAPVRAHEWALRELTRNLLHNAIAHTPAQGRLAVALVADARHVALTIADSGPGIAPELRRRLFQPFAAGGEGGGSGLGLAICHEIVAALAGEIRLDNRVRAGRVVGLDATVRLALADNGGA